MCSDKPLPSAGRAFPMPANCAAGSEPMKRDIEIRTADGMAKAGLFGAASAGVILYMDAFGPRPALDGMAEHIAGWGYAVLVPDLFYRNAPYGPFDAKTAFGDDKSRAELMGLIGGTTQEMTKRDTA